MEVFKFVSHLVVDDSNVLGWSTQLYIPNDIVDSLPVRPDGTKRVTCFIEGLEPWSCAPMSDGNGGYFILFSKEKIKVYQRIDHVDFTAISVELKPDLSKYGVPLPVELEEAFYIYPEGKGYFDDLTPGKQRNIIFRIAKPKGEQTRIKKAIVVMEYLMSTNGAFDFKALNAFEKEYNAQ